MIKKEYMEMMDIYGTTYSSNVKPSKLKKTIKRRKIPSYPRSTTSSIGSYNTKHVTNSTYTMVLRLRTRARTRKIVIVLASSTLFRHITSSSQVVFSARERGSM